jgi:hypothetical protein
MDAALIVEALARNGIRATAMGGYTSGFRAEAPGEVHIVVAQQDVVRASQVLSEIRSKEEPVDWSEVDLGEVDPPAQDSRR